MKRKDPKTHKPCKRHCRICGSKAEDSEVELTNSDYIDYNGYYNPIFIKCPMCGAWNVEKTDKRLLK